MTIALTATTGRLGAKSMALNNRSIVLLVSLLLFAPTIIFALSLKILPAIALTVGSCGGLWVIATGRAQGDGAFMAAPVEARRYVACVAVALAIFVLGGETHLFYATFDWRVRDAVLADLAQRPFPVTYAVGDIFYTLRAPLGMYIVPGALGRIFGLMGAHAVMLIQNVVILGSVFYLLMSLGGGWRNLAVLILFGGLSILGAALALGYASDPADRMDLLLSSGLDAWHPYFQYSSSIVQFFWAPNHALPAWWLATLLLLQARSEVDAATLGVSLAGAMLWSPLAVAGVLVWLLYLVATDWRRHLLDWRTWAGAVFGAGFLPAAIFMLIDSAGIAHGVTAEKPVFTMLYVLFIALQLPAALFVFLNRRLLSGLMFALFRVNVVILLILPLFNFGPCNDLVMRGSITSLVVVAFDFGLVLCHPELSRKARIAGYALVLLGSASALLEASRNVAYRRYDVSDCSLMESYYALGGKSIPNNYAVENARIPGWLLDPSGSTPLVAKPRSCWSDGYRAPPL